MRAFFAGGQFPGDLVEDRLLGFQEMVEFVGRALLRITLFSLLASVKNFNRRERRERSYFRSSFALFASVKTLTEGNEGNV